MLRFARAVDDAAHDGHVHRFHARIRFFPFRHLLAQIRLDVVGQLLEGGRRGAATARTGDHHRRELAQAHGLQNFLADDDFARAVTARLRRERDADGVADALLQQHGQRRGGRHDTLAAHARFRQAQVQRIVAALGQFAVHGDQVLHARDLARQDDLVAAQAQLFGAHGVFNRRRHQRFVHDGLRRPRVGAARVFVHDARQQGLIQAAPVHADAHRLVVLASRFDHLRKLRVALGALAHVARIDAVLRQRARAIGVIVEQGMAVIVKIAHQRHVDVHLVELLADVRHGGRRFRTVHRQAHQFRTGTRQFLDLDRRADGVGRIRVRHRLHHHGGVAAHPDLALAVRDQHLAAVAAAGRTGADRCFRGSHNIIF